MASSCPLCSAALDGVDYAAHLRDVHGLHDDPGTSSAGATPEPTVTVERTPQSPSTSLGEVAIGGPSIPRGVRLVAGEEFIAFVDGEGPPPPAIGGRNRGAIVAGGVLGGAIGAAAVAAATSSKGERHRGNAEVRTLVLTTKRLLLLKFHIPDDAFPVDAIKRVNFKALGPLRRAAIVKANNGRTMRVEGPRVEVERFVATTNAYLAVVAAEVAAGRWRP